MVRKIRSDKKNTICKYCDYECLISQKLHEYFKQKNLYKVLLEITAFIQISI